MLKRLRVKYSLFLSDFNETFTFSTDFLKNSNIKFRHNPSVWAEFYADGQTGVTKPVVVFRNLGTRRKRSVAKYRLS
jgi:hypothetical protein